MKLNRLLQERQIVARREKELLEKQSEAVEDEIRWLAQSKVNNVAHFFHQEFEQIREGPLMGSFPKKSK